MASIEWKAINLLLFLKKFIPKTFYGKIAYFLLLPGIVTVGFLAVGLVYLGSYSIFKFDPYHMVVYTLTSENYVLLFVLTFQR